MEKEKIYTRELAALLACEFRPSHNSGPPLVLGLPAAVDEALGSGGVPALPVSRHGMFGGCCAQSWAGVAGRMALWGSDPVSPVTIFPDHNMVWNTISAQLIFTEGIDITLLWLSSQALFPGLSAFNLEEFLLHGIL